MCPHTTIYASSYCYVCDLSHLYICIKVLAKRAQRDNEASAPRVRGIKTQNLFSEYNAQTNSTYLIYEVDVRMAFVVLVFFLKKKFS